MVHTERLEQFWRGTKKPFKNKKQKCNNQLYSQLSEEEFKTSIKISSGNYFPSSSKSKLHSFEIRGHDYMEGPSCLLYLQRKTMTIRSQMFMLVSKKNLE